VHMFSALIPCLRALFRITGFIPSS
jgi:hypothetical protein